MKIILSRKGFDSAAGGVPSPIMPDGSLCSLPIPDEGSGIRYGDVKWRGLSLGPIVDALTRGNVRPHHEVHLDPDINPMATRRAKGWRGLFGQTNGSQTHLERNGVGIGDVFLFFGWFRQTERLADGRLGYVRGSADLHVLFGWLQIGAISKVARFSNSDLSWAGYHPHFRHAPSQIDTLYTASETLKLSGLSPKLPGAGVFPRYCERLCVTAPGATRSNWRLPKCFHPRSAKSAMSYHSNMARWRLDGEHTLLRTVGRGQEFVLDCDQHPGVCRWLASLFNDSI